MGGGYRGCNQGWKSHKGKDKDEQCGGEEYKERIEKGRRKGVKGKILWKGGKKGVEVYNEGKGKGWKERDERKGLKEGRRKGDKWISWKRERRGGLSEQWSKGELGERKGLEKEGEKGIRGYETKRWKEER